MAVYVDILHKAIDWLSDSVILYIKMRMWGIFSQNNSIALYHHIVGSLDHYILLVNAFQSKQSEYLRVWNNIICFLTN